MNYNRHVLLVAALFAGLAIGVADVRAQTTLRLLSGWSPNNSNVPEVETPFIKNVELASKGQIKIERRGPEVVPPFDQLQPVSAGVFDILFTSPAYHLAQSGVGVFMDALKPGLEERRASGLLEKVDEYYRRQFGLRLIAIVPLTGNNFVMKDGLAPDGTLKGMKIRANATFEGVVRALGGTPVNLSAADAYAALQKGVLEGAAFPAFANSDYKLHEVSKSMTRPVFGLANVAFFVNARKFDSLPPDRQRILLEEARKIEVIGKAAMERVTQADEAKMKANGVEIVSFSVDLAPKLNSLFNEGIRATASATSPNEVAELWELAKTKNLLNQ